MSKGQTAMEYLMTYGWAILIVLVVGAVLYFYGFFTPGKLVGASIQGFTKLRPLQVDIDSAGNIRVLLENRVGEEINLAVVYGRTAGSGAYVLSPTNVSTIRITGRSDFITVTGIGGSGTTGDTYNFDLAFQYYLVSTGSGTQFNSTGTISGTRS